MLYTHAYVIHVVLQLHNVNC